MSHTPTSPTWVQHLGRTSDQWRGHFRPALLLAALLILCPLGCSKDEVKKAFDSAAAKTQELAKSSVEKIEQQLPETGSVSLQVTPAVEIKSANVQVISIGDGRPNVVQVVTYDPQASSTSFPRMMLHGTTTVTSAAALSGEEVQCDMYYQNSYSSPIAMTKPGSSVVVKFTRFDPERKVVEASLGMANLMGSDGKTVKVGGGSLVAMVGEN